MKNTYDKSSIIVRISSKTIFLFLQRAGKINKKQTIAGIYRAVMVQKIVVVKGNTNIL